VHARLKTLMGANPFPGTLNLRISPDVREELFSRRKQFVPIDAPGAATCSAYLITVNVIVPNSQQLQAWSILPELTIHSDVLEVVSQYSLRHRMSLTDGDNVTIEVYVPNW
jgi:CTP-dependent riboflavin kinase